MRHTIIFLSLLFFSISCYSQNTIKTMFYNVLWFPELNPNRIDLLQVVLQDYEPDIFMVCELQNQEGADAILNIGLNSDSNSNCIEIFCHEPKCQLSLLKICLN